MRGSRVIGVILAVGLALGVAALVVLPRLGSDEPTLTTVRALVGSEKQPLLTDPDTTAALKRAGYRLLVDTAGSREIATARDLTGYDLVFPADSPQADRIRHDRKITASYVPFYSPMAIATFRPILGLLEAAGVAHAKGDTVMFDMRTYLDLVAHETRWSQLPGNTVYPTEKSILISSTDVRTSNSAALYLAITSYVANGNRVVTDAATGERMADLAAPLFLRQGYLEASSQEPFEDFLTIGMGKTPMVMIYEAQFLARVISKDPAIRPDMVLMYPSPTIYAKHTVVPLTPAGDAVGRLLTEDPELQRLAARFGFRTASGVVDPAQGSGGSAGGQPGTSSPQLADVVEPPSLEILEMMIKRIESKY